MTDSKPKLSPTDKITAILDKVETDDLYDIIGNIKQYAAKRMADKQAQLENVASDLQSKIEKLKG